MIKSMLLSKIWKILMRMNLRMKKKKKMRRGILAIQTYKRSKDREQERTKCTKNSVPIL